tara:strand:- start:4180 stop:6885 length:2706 start_codon:yes stop_codon:yes gene_type:complete
MRKLIIALISLVLIGLVGYVLIPIESKTKNFGYSEALNAISPKASFIIRSDNIIDKWRELSNSTIGKSLSNIKSYSAIQSVFSRIDSTQNKFISSFLNQKVFIAGVLTAGNQLNQIVAFENKGATQEQVKGCIESIFGSKALSSKEYENNTIDVYALNETKITFAHVGKVVLFSTSGILIEEGIRELSAERHLPDHAGFKKLLKTADIRADGNFFINFNQIGGCLNLYGNNYIDFSKSFSQFGGWAELDLNSRDQSWMLNGFSFISDSSSSYLNSFSGEKAQSLSVSSVLPENTGVLSYISFSNFSSYKEKYNQYLSQKQILYKHQKNLLNINKKHKFTVEDDFYSWIGDEIAMFTVSGDETSFERNSGLIIKISDLDKAKDGLRKIHESTGVQSETLYQTLVINDLGLINFFPLVLGEEFKSISGSKYLVIEDYIVFANDESVLKHIVNFYLRGKTLVKNFQFNQFYSQFSTESNLFYYYNFKLANNYFGSLLKNNQLESYRANKDSLNKLQAFGFQINANKKLFFTNAYINYNTFEGSQNISLIEVKLDTTYSIRPFIVKNHYTKEKELLIQDDNNMLYLVNNVGKIIWKKDLKEPIVGSIQQVDRYKNDKLQYTFVTKNKIHQIDRKSRDVEGYPVKLKEPVTKGLVVFDYDQNRNYRMLVTQGKHIHNFNIDGKVVKGWNFISGDNIVVEPGLIQVQDKDYIVLSDESGRVRVLNRKGEDRIKLNNQFPPQTNNYSIWKNNALSNSGVLGTDTNGIIYFLKLADEMETFIVKSFEGDFDIEYNDFNGDGTLDFIILNDQSVQVFKNNKKIDATISDVEFKPAYGVETFQLDENRTVNILTDKNEMKIYGYDEKGNLLNSFPIEGISPSLITDIDNNKSYDLIVGDKLGSLYIYSLEN